MLHCRLLFVSLVAAVLVLPACPPASIVGTWGYWDCDGTPLGTIRFAAGGTVEIHLSGVGGTDPMAFRIAEVDGTGTWTEENGQVQITSDVIHTITETDPMTMEESVISSTNGLFLFMGTVLDLARMEGNATSNVPVGGPCVVMLR